MKQYDLTKGLVFFLTIIITLCCGLIPSSWALSDDENYNKILKGKYTYSQAGSIQVGGVEGVELPFGAVGSFITDGKGKIYCGIETVRLGGNTIMATFEGDYELDENFMGTVTIDIEASDHPKDLSMEMAIAVTKDGEEVHLLTTKIINNSASPYNYPMEPFAVVGFGSRNTD